ncbi:MAG: anthranilate phosphoribosyltransferase [Kiritimatiellae bacterium]|nr:anthranilate phosphoribosyltransferase [Kiritimatiellia bacterium]
MNMDVRETFRRMMSGGMSADEIRGVLTAFHETGIGTDDLTAAAEAMREAGVKVVCENPDAVDIVGTGGDFAGTFNVSTTAAFIAAGAGVVIAKHGNRAATSKCGTADVLEALGYDLATPPERIAEMIRADGIGFLFARNLHPAMRYAAPVRRELKFKTIFNYLGPLTNPAGVRQHVIGVPDPAMTGVFAQTLDRLGSRSALIVCGSDGMDEISTDGVTHFAMLRDGVVSEGEFDVRRLCGESYPASAIAGGEPEENAMILRGVLNGGLTGAYRLAAVLNAAAAIWVADRARSLKEGIAVAERSIDSGAALRKLESFVGAGGGGRAGRNVLVELTERRRKDVEKASRTRDFAAAFKGGGLHVIAELKKASPSKGLIRTGFRAAELARELTAGGAAALSVLAEPHRFLGGEENVRQAREASELPILFKDFVSTEYQILRARACGADAVLLIVAAVARAEELKKLLACARSHGMEALVETHDAGEIDAALAAGAKVIGVNCRDLRTFETDPSRTAALLGRIPADCVRIAESGIRSHGDLLALRRAGADGFLIGETLMRAEHPGEELAKLIKEN